MIDYKGESKSVTSKVGIPLKLIFCFQGFCNDDAAAVKFRDQIVDLEEAHKFSQNFSTLVSEIGRRYTTIILYLDQARVNCKFIS